MAEVEEINESSLSYVAQMIMDLYYQNVKSSEDFFELPHFIFAARAIYGKLLEIESDKARRLAKEETGYYTIDVSQDWLIEEVVKVEKVKGGGKYAHYVGELKETPFPFPFDTMGYGVQSVELIEPSDCESSMIRINRDQKDSLKHLPKTNSIYWFVQGKKVHGFTTSICEPKEWGVNFAPALSLDADKAIIPLGKQADIISFGVNLFKGAAQGMIVDMSNDRNPNKIIETEINKMQAKS